MMFGQNIADLTEPRSVETKQNFFDRQVTFLIFEFGLQQEIDKSGGAQRGKAQLYVYCRFQDLRLGIPFHYPTNCVSKY